MLGRAPVSPARTPQVPLVVWFTTDSLKRLHLATIHKLYSY